jgi:hypothetical protein
MTTLLSSSAATSLLITALFLIAVATVWHFAAKHATESAAREAALRIETAKAVQRQRAAYDAAGVAESAAQDVPKRKHRKKVL